MTIFETSVTGILVIYTFMINNFIHWHSLELVSPQDADYGGYESADAQAPE